MFPAQEPADGRGLNRRPPQETRVRYRLEEAPGGQGVTRGTIRLEEELKFLTSETGDDLGPNWMLTLELRDGSRWRAQNWWPGSEGDPVIRVELVQIAKEARAAYLKPVRPHQRPEPPPGTVEARGAGRIMAKRDLAYFLGLSYLTDEEVDQLVAFMEALDGEGYQDTEPTAFPE